jgi:hypothetical protein
VQATAPRRGSEPHGASLAQGAAQPGAAFAAARAAHAARALWACGATAAACPTRPCRMVLHLRRPSLHPGGAASATGGSGPGQDHRLRGAMAVCQAGHAQRHRHVQGLNRWRPLDGPAGR